MIILLCVCQEFSVQLFQISMRGCKKIKSYKLDEEGKKLFEYEYDNKGTKIKYTSYSDGEKINFVYYFTSFTMASNTFGFS